METFTSTTITIPVVQLVLLILFSTLALLFGKQTLALLINYLFVFYWGFGANLQNQTALNPEVSVWFHSSYIIFGCLFVIFSLIGLLKRT
jgi:hypothetical protein